MKANAKPSTKRQPAPNRPTGHAAQAAGRAPGTPPLLDDPREWIDATDDRLRAVTDSELRRLDAALSKYPDSRGIWVRCGVAHLRYATVLGSGPSVEVAELLHPSEAAAENESPAERALDAIGDVLTGFGHTQLLRAPALGQVIQGLIDGPADNRRATLGLLLETLDNELMSVQDDWEKALDLLADSSVPTSPTTSMADGAAVLS